MWVPVSNCEETPKEIIEYLGKDKVAEINQVIDFIVRNPDIQRFFINLPPPSTLTNMTFEQRNRLVENKKGMISTNEQFGIRYLDILARSIAGETLTQEEKSILMFAENQDYVSRLIPDGANFAPNTGIFDINKHIAKGLLIHREIMMRGFVESGYQKHNEDYNDFVARLGVNPPLWFRAFGKGAVKPYLKPPLHSTKANSSGAIFIDIHDSEDGVREILNHESVHILVNEASKLNPNKNARPTFTSDESFVQTMALIIQFHGDLELAIKHNENSRINYKGGVDTLLRMLQEIEAKDQEVFSGSRLLYQSLIEFSEGKNTNPFEYVSDRYDLLYGRGEFMDKMHYYNDKNRTLLKSKVVLRRDNQEGEALEVGIQEPVMVTFQNVLDSINFQNISGVWFPNEESFKKALNKVKNNPETLLDINSDIRYADAIRDIIFSNNDAIDEFKNILSTIILNIVKMSNL